MSQYILTLLFPLEIPLVYARVDNVLDLCMSVPANWSFICSQSCDMSIVKVARHPWVSPLYQVLELTCNNQGVWPEEVFHYRATMKMLIRMLKWQSLWACMVHWCVIMGPFLYVCPDTLHSHHCKLPWAECWVRIPFPFSSLDDLLTPDGLMNLPTCWWPFFEISNNMARVSIRSNFQRLLFSNKLLNTFDQTVKYAVSTCVQWSTQ